MNADPRSLFLNTELALLIRSAPLAEAATRYFREASGPENAYRIDLVDGGIRWHDAHAGRSLTREPDVAWWWPAAAWLLSLLPIRKLL